MFITLDEAIDEQFKYLDDSDPVKVRCRNITQSETYITKTNKDTNNGIIVHVSCLQQQARLAEKLEKTWKNLENSVREYL